MKTYRVSLTGRTPLLMHQDNIEWADHLRRWREDSQNKKRSCAGDDRSPGFTWIGSLYHDGSSVALPHEVLMRVAMEGAAMVAVPGGKHGKTFKSQSQSGCGLTEPFWTLLVGGKDVSLARIRSVESEVDFDKHQDLAARLGFLLFVKRAKVGMAKHIRVRPRFDNWSASGFVTAWDDQITLPVLRQIWSCAGQYKGIGDWRPGGKTPGTYGMFSAVVEEA